MTPSPTAPDEASPTLCLTPGSPLEWEPAEALPSLGGRLAELLPWGDTSGLRSRSVWVAGLFPVCFLLLATMVPGREPGFGSRRAVERSRGCVSSAAPSEAPICSPDLICPPRTTGALPPLQPRCSTRSSKCWRAAPSTGRSAPLQTTALSHFPGSAHTWVTFETFGHFLDIFAYSVQVFF